MNAGRLIARLTIGGLFVGHGTQKLFGWFDGPGPEGTAEMMENLGLRPPREQALAAGITETAGGAMLALGALTPLAGALLSGTMFTAIRKVHLPKGLWNTGGGYEFNLVLVAAVAALIDGGPGRPSVDHALGIDRTGSGWALAALAAGAAGSAFATGAAPLVEQAQQSQSQQEGSAADQVPAGATA
ncbi:MAG: putative oxidoreductase [Thermoleophilaceae bacterium]|jgi:putative oxidoreductase|nr:putative oxidoreductase [Thermoleophilaceae bacterium]